MKKAMRIALGSATLALGLAFAGAARANAQVRFEGSFPLPHGRISVNVAGPAFSPGAYVPEGYAVYDDPEYGYGFSYGDQWISCEPYGSRWVIVERRPFFGRRDFRNARPSWRWQSRGYYRRDFDDRRFERDDRFRSFGRDHRRFRDDRDSRRGRDRFGNDRRDGRRDDRSWDHDRRRNR
jgi:hypothetical protein